jgi:hypothetical protein
LPQKQTLEEKTEIDGKPLTEEQLEEVQAEYACEIHELTLELAH